MQTDAPLDQVIETIHTMSRSRCIHELTHFDALPLDFHVEFLESRSDEWLRHTLLAAVLAVHHRPCGRSS